MAWQNEFTPLIYDVIDSTNSEAIRIAKRGCIGNFLVWGGVQTAGRGKYGRTWHSEAGNLHFSLLINKRFPVFKASQLVYVASIALVNSLNFLKEKFFDNSHNRFFIKWPNDIILNTRKCAGILLESQISTAENSCDFVVIGIGVNTKVCPQSHDLNFEATSLFENGIFIDNSDLIDNFMINFKDYYKNWDETGFSFTQNEWMRHAFMIGQNIKVTTSNDVIVGKLKGVNEDGLLIIEAENGEDIKISSGEVFFLS